MHFSALRVHRRWGCEWNTRGIGRAATGRGSGAAHARAQAMDTRGNGPAGGGDSPRSTLERGALRHGADPFCALLDAEVGNREDWRGAYTRHADGAWRDVRRQRSGYQRPREEDGPETEHRADASTHEAEH